MRLLLLVAGALGGVSLCGCASPEPPGALPTAVDFEHADQGQRLLAKERSAFDARYKLEGERAGPAMRQLKEDGYECRIVYFDLPERVGEMGVRIVRKPRLHCELPSKQPEDVCKLRRVSLNLDWPDLNAGTAELLSQIPSRRITNRNFYCEAADWMLSRSL
jgi:hypothetical protein